MEGHMVNAIPGSRRNCMLTPFKCHLFRHGEDVVSFLSPLEVVQIRAFGMHKFRNLLPHLVRGERYL